MDSQPKLEELEIVVDRTSVQIAEMQTKLDFIVEHIQDARTSSTKLTDRVDSLESQSQWIKGGSAVVIFAVGLLLFAAQSFIDARAYRLIQSTQITDEEILSKTCRQYRRENPSTTELPLLCRR